jgi:hypothetical protein
MGRSAADDPFSLEQLLAFVNYSRVIAAAEPFLHALLFSSCGSCLRARLQLEVNSRGGMP